MTFRPELIDELLKDYKNVDDLMGQGGIFKQLSKALIELCLTAELDTYLEEEKSNRKQIVPRIGVTDIAKRRLKESLVNQKYKSRETSMVGLNRS